jgi:hypothetical protein
MKRLRAKLTYSNVMVTVLAVLVLGGGTAYAASHLGKNSVGARQLKKGAVTPAKLNNAAKSTITGPRGATGATGAAGAPGTKGDRGETGPQGPGAVFIEGHVGESSTTVATIDGIEIVGACLPGSAPITLKAETGSKLAYFGLRTLEATVSSARGRNVASVSAGAGVPNVEIYFLARNEAVDKAWQRFDLHLATENCELTGMVTPSTSG